MRTTKKTKYCSYILANYRNRKSATLLPYSSARRARGKGASVSDRFSIELREAMMQAIVYILANHRNRKSAKRCAHRRAFPPRAPCKDQKPTTMTFVNAPSTMKSRKFIAMFTPYIFRRRSAEFFTRAQPTARAARAPATHIHRNVSRKKGR